MKTIFHLVNWKSYKYRIWCQNNKMSWIKQVAAVYSFIQRWCSNLQYTEYFLKALSVRVGTAFKSTVVLLLYQKTKCAKNYAFSCDFCHFEAFFFAAPGAILDLLWIQMHQEWPNMNHAVKIHWRTVTLDQTGHFNQFFSFLWSNF